MAYESLQAILEEAGLSQVVSQETPAGTIDGSNKVFTVAHLPLADTNYDDVVDATDVTVYVNGVPVTVNSVNAVTGAITLATAPAVSASVLVNYRYSSVTLEETQKAREEAEDMIDQELKTVTDRPATSPTIRKIVRWYAGGMVMARDYGFQADTQGTSKDAKAKMDQAELWLVDYAALLIEQATHPDPEEYVMAETDTDLDVFTTYDRASGMFSSGTIPNADEQFIMGTDWDNN